jgi:tetratricopeptide (TPR) repeat protein
MGNFDGAKVELQESIRIKPDFDLAHSSLGILYSSLKNYAGAMVEFKKAVTLNPDNLDARYDLGNAYSDAGDNIAAIREYREVKRRDPKRLDVRQNLGATLLETDPSAAITEFRELAALAPDFPVCRYCLASALRKVGRNTEAEKEYRAAAQADPTDPAP